ncbi:MAG: type II toxin-antitoxin system Phd/YefM family antitoxin [Peptococcaceae bacterium]|jgi:prevent-host-death family protein|nr:type II toxin-antitoxin system Phd/YefM family antitoxin [Peptococcaceae bacterium]
MPRIRPITDLRNTTEISELCHQSHEPIFITKNGYGDLVVMSIESYERQFAKATLYAKLAAAEKQVADGAELIDADEVFSRLRVKHVK